MTYSITSNYSNALTSAGNAYYTATTSLYDCDFNLLQNGVYYKGTWLTDCDLEALIKRKQAQTPKKPVSKERVVFDKDYTIYYDNNGKKTVVHKAADQPYDAEKAVLYALLKSKGIEPKKVTKLVDNAIDKNVKRLERESRKAAKRLEKKGIIGGTYKVYYGNEYDEEDFELLTIVDSLDEAKVYIDKHLKKLGVESPYQRWWKDDSIWTCDYGSWSKFFYVEEVPCQ